MIPGSMLPGSALPDPTTSSGTATPPDALLDVRGLRKVFSSQRLFSPKREVCAAEDVSFRLSRGEAIALVGESGSGKSTIARLLLRLEKPDRGQIRLGGEDVLAREPRRASLKYRGRVQMVFQDPFGSLNPVHSVGHHLIRPLQRHLGLIPHSSALRTRAGLWTRALELLGTVGLGPAEDYIRRYPHELSGGQRQRVAIARALAVAPDLLVADEPTSMLDVSIRMGVLNLLAELKREKGLSVILITHDLASARYLADRILVLYRGRLVEDGPSAEVVTSPAHPYTRALLASIADARVAGSTPAEGAKSAPKAAVAPAPSHQGCPFAARCAERMSICDRKDPAARPVGARMVRCHLYPAAAQPAAAAAGAHA